mmetsp:Transcript_33783/g.41766  ORF Transcript_33783/g.41766 Transcript_33783/m.41766 type:complete len:133 (-) Transcript_33783:278-676(-)|eukprot:CAMPEP_0170450654 /NCGR_PEP_ID=MMETSP0123-20130129/117_1 /TAXON_ID=182087 /ORGANISM="Favella ehrenbergii, Strain Fehren 1" /LENGTH=132 /DNA_ID=CAMNT_0010712005 /DNA_START=3 /DNA_END=401 /DNA_ORIENTATION=-
MVDSGEQSQGADLVLTSLDNIPQMQTPSLCEIWNWQGDTSVLPYKFESVLNSASTEAIYEHAALKQQYVKSERFDPEGFFFLTYRSNAIGLTLAYRCTDDPSCFELPYLVCVPNHRNKGVESALLALILQYC